VETAYRFRLLVKINWERYFTNDVIFIHIFVLKVIKQKGIKTGKVYYYYCYYCCFYNYSYFCCYQRSRLETMMVAERILYAVSFSDDAPLLR